MNDLTPLNVATANRPGRMSPKLAEIVSYAWYSHHGGGRMDIPIGVIGALMLLLPGGSAEQKQIQDEWAKMSHHDFRKVFEHLWSRAWAREPYLTTVARPIWSWTDDDRGLSEQEFIAARQVAKAAINHGLWRITAYEDPYLRSQEDVLSYVVTELRSRGTRRSLGEFHTPPDVSDLMAAITLGDCVDIPPGNAFDDCAAGTGGLLRSAAQWLREHGRDPATMRWSMTEIDGISAACCAVNSLVWDLGPNVLIWHGDTLTEGNTIAKAAEMKRRVWAQWRAAHRDASRIVGARRADALM